MLFYYSEKEKIENGEEMELVIKKGFSFEISKVLMTYPTDNGLAVVLVKRGACGGCFSSVPPQRQTDIKDKKKLIVCEHCGRILAGVEDPIPAPEKEKKTRGKAAAAATTAE